MKLPFIKLLKRRNATVATGRERNWFFLFTGVLSLTGLIYMVVALPPTHIVSLNELNFSVIYLTFLLLWLSSFCIFSFIFKSAKHGVLTSLFIVAFFWLRLNKLLHPMFAILLAALFLTLELLFTAKKER